MREIKFRFWHEKLDRYVYLENFNYGVDYSEWVDETGKPWEVITKELEQYTGFKDSEGKEIYEGDKIIVLHVHDGDEAGNWNQEKQEPIINIITWDEKRGAWNFPARFVYASHDFKIIGNIHEKEGL